MLEGQDVDSDLEEKMMEFQDINTYIAQYREKLGCDKDSENIKTAVDRVFGLTHEKKGFEGCKIDFQSF